MATKKKEKTKIDIILPNYNSSNFIIRTIRSILKQTYKNWKLIIVDDFSDIKTRKKIRKYAKLKKVKIYWLKKNKGAAYCRNLAISKSKSNYLAFIDSDDIWEKNKLRLQIQYMKKNNYDFTYTNYIPFKKNKKPCTDSFKIANELKVIIYNKSDFEFAEQMSREVSLDCKLFF